MNDLIIIQPIGRRSKYLTVFILIVWIAVMVWLFLRSSGSYLPAWFFLQSISLLLIIWISMPRKLVLSQQRLLVVCTLRLVSIFKEEIDSIDRMDSKSFPVFSTMGFLGYIGIYYLKKEKCFAEVYSRSWNNMILIRCKSGKRYIVGVDNVENFLGIYANYGY